MQFLGPQFYVPFLRLWNSAKTFYSTLQFTGTANRTHTLQDKDGTLAQTTDVHDAAAKTPIDADEVGIVDSAASWVQKKVTLTNFKVFLKTYFDTLYPLRANNLSDLANAGTARANLGLGTLATQSGTFSGTSSGTNTGDQATITGNAGTATALQTSRTIDGVAFDGTANIAVVAPATFAATSKSSPVDADSIPLVDSAASNVLKKLTWANIKATLATWIAGGTIAGSFTTLASSGNTTLGGASTDTLNVGNGGIVKDANGNVGIGVAPTGRLSVAGAVNIASDNTGVLGIGRYSAGYGGAAIDFQGGATFGAFQFSGVEKARIDSSGNVLAVSATGGLGYGIGAGGTATQATSRSTGVTVNKPTGVITLFSKTATTGSIASFTLTNTLIAATDVVIVNFASATSADKYSLFVTAVAAGSCRIQVYNIAAVAVAEAPVINFAVIKGATS